MTSEQQDGARPAGGQDYPVRTNEVVGDRAEQPASGSAPETTSTQAPAAEAVPLHVRAGQTRDRLKGYAKTIMSAATALAPLTKGETYEDLEKLRKRVPKIESKIPAELRQESDISGLFTAIRTFEKEAGERLRQRLGRELKEACEKAGLALHVISREPPIEVRIPPFSVVMSFEKGQAELRFARLPIAQCAADAKAILKTHAEARQSLEGHFDAEQFFERCLRAWRAARAAGGESLERVEILDFLPYLTLEMQGPKFKVEPQEANFKGYGRSRFAYDVLRLRREKKLTQNGMRLNLGVATGTTASQKKRVIYFEDEDGNGEYKLTLFFTRTEESSS